jgi:cell division protein FtsW
MLVVGIVSWITFQAFVNIMGITKLIPLTGITLPFISYGSTSLVTVLMASGILLNISKYSKKTNKK